MTPQGNGLICISLLVVMGLVGLTTAQQPGYGGTLPVAWESEMTGVDPHWSPGLQVQYDVRVRQALGGYGIDRQAIATVVMVGLGQALWRFVPLGAWEQLKAVPTRRSSVG